MIGWLLWIAILVRTDARSAHTLANVVALGLVPFGLGGWWYASYVSTKDPELRWIFLPLLVAGVGVMIARRVRPLSGRAAIPTASCQFCKEDRPVALVRYIEITGALIFIYAREVSGFACSKCSHRMCLRMSIKTLFLGWWDLVAFFATPAALLSNVLFLVRSKVVPAESRYARAQVGKVLDEHRAYALNMLAAKDEQTVAEVLGERSGLTVDQVRAWLRRIAAERRAVVRVA